ncbi:MAG: hypothetical protein MK135_03990 [Polyangiaceae bacterium]|nr:hypothetical protein [Polyangiaceae bacterium]
MADSGKKNPQASTGVSSKASEDPRASSLAVDGASEKNDVVLVGGPTDDQQGLRVLRARGQKVELGEVRPVQEGKPMNGDLVSLQPRQSVPGLYDVTTHYQSESGSTKGASGTSSSSTEQSESQVAGAITKGPAQVATSQYRQNWDQIWASSASKRKEQPN